jgi:hypothetical protein
MEVKPFPRDLGGFPPRPAHFAAPNPTQRLEGFSGHWQEITFRDHHRAFYLFIGVGQGASTLLPTLLNALDTLHVGK